MIRNFQKAVFTLGLLLFTTLVFSTGPKIYIAFQWHMHQPIYYPYENCLTTDASGKYSYSILDIHNSRSGPYTTWPKNAVQKGIDAGMAHFGAQVSFSGSLIENLNNIEAAGKGFSGWKSSWISARANKTAKGNPRLDMVGFGYHHPLMGLIDYTDIRKQIQLHKVAFTTYFPGTAYSKGIFPPENAFSERMIPALVDEGLQWVLVDNIHFERASANCPVGDQTNILRPNISDIRNPDPNDWQGLQNVWCPSKISGGWAHRPHYVSYTDPATGIAKKIIAVPTSRYIGNEDGRGGFGALNYESVLSQLAAANTDASHPILVVLHHDGDNFGGGTDSYYGSNFQAFVDWLKTKSEQFECTTVQDYLDLFPVAENDVIHVQDGSWSGADNGDPQFKKWNGDPGKYTGATGNYSPDRNSWGVMTAAKNILETADKVNAAAQGTKDGWKYYLNGQTSCYWYWDGTEIWDSNPARAANLAIASAKPVAQSGTDLVSPSMYVPQRIPYNPGEIEWSSVGYMSCDFKVWTYVYDMSGLSSVTLKYRTMTSTKITSENLTFAGGSTVGAWSSLVMTPASITSITNPVPTNKADEYSATIAGLKNKMVDYYVEAIDTKGNVRKSDIFHTWVGNGDATNPNAPSVTVSPVGGTYIGGTTVTLSSSAGTAPVNIYYTTDGTTPTSASTKYSGSFEISKNGTILKAIAVDANGLTSTIASHTYITDANTSAIKVYFYCATWTSANAYVWTGSNTTHNGGWPGSPATNEGNGWFSYTAPISLTSFNIIFSGSGGKTADVVGVNSSRCYEWAGNIVAPKLGNCPLATSLVENSELADEALKVYPNPMSSILNIEIESTLGELFDLKLRSIEGSVVAAGEMVSNERWTLERNSLTSGIYFLEVIGRDSGLRAVRKIIIK